jgi:integrase
MRKSALTQKRVDRLLKRPGRYRDALVRGLLLVVVSPTNASWQLRYQQADKERWLGLGPVNLIGIKAARERAKKARLQLLDGIDPIAAKQAAKVSAKLAAANTLSFEAAATQYFDQHEAKWRSAKHRAQFLSSLTQYAFPVIGTLPVGAIDTALVLRVIEPIWHIKTETANRVRGRIEAVLDWAAVRGYRAPGDNPARWKGHLSNVLPERNRIQKPQHLAALPYPEVPGFMAALVARPGVVARALEFCILTAARTSEVVGARWAELDLKDKVWTVPANRIKGGREHRVPLSDAVIALLKALPRERDNDFVFIGRRHGGISPLAMLAVVKRMGHETTHGFRSSFRDWAAERTNFPREVAEMALAHTVGDAVERAYRRGDLFDKRRRLMEEWARYPSLPLATILWRQPAAANQKKWKNVSKQPHLVVGP